MAIDLSKLALSLDSTEDNFLNSRLTIMRELKVPSQSIPDKSKSNVIERENRLVEHSVSSF